jgi:hypothetical protein
MATRRLVVLSTSLNDRLVSQLESVVASEAGRASVERTLQRKNAPSAGALRFRPWGQT